ncbi:hypothetical protein BGZ94_005518 [Podila epigama]|nr:hypothetical protein BGZ94_005518 [Podila epigama]
MLAAASIRRGAAFIPQWIQRTANIESAHQVVVSSGGSTSSLSKFASRVLVHNRKSTNRYFTLASKWNKDTICLTPKVRSRLESRPKSTSAHPTFYSGLHASYSQRSKTLSFVPTHHNHGPRPWSQHLWQASQRAGFHHSEPNLALPLLPAALMTLKTPVAAVVLRMISRISLTLLPLSAKQSPRIILTLVAIPPICFGLVIFAGLEAAPNTGRWRFLFTSEQEELDLLKDEIPSFLETVQVIDDEDDARVRLVKHILANLLSTSIEQDGSTLRTGIVERLEKKHEEAQQKMAELRQREANQKNEAEKQQQQQQQQQQQTKGSVPTNAIVSTNGPVRPVSAIPAEEEEEEDADMQVMTFDERPFQIFVTKDDSINAFSLGPPRLLFINSGLMEWLENDEDLVAAVVAHELAHVIQRHTMETHGRETVMLFLADLFRSALWTISIPLGPWFNSWVDKTTNDLLHFTASGPLHQAIEVEADTVSLTLLALAGYDPMHAVRLWEQWAEKDQKEIEEQDTAEVHKWTDWMYDHPPSAERARYLKEAVMPAREMWEKVLKRRKQPVKRFESLENRLKTHVDEDGDYVDGTVEDVMETMDELLQKQEEQEKEEKRRKGVLGTLRRVFGYT